MHEEVNYYYVDRNRELKFFSYKEAYKFALEISREFHYFPTISVDKDIVFD